MMKYWILICSLAIFSACGGGAKEENSAATTAVPAQPKTVQVGAATTASINKMLSAYYQVKDALVEYDTSAANQAAAALVVAADSVNIKEVTDSTLASTLQNFSGSIASEARALMLETDLGEKKRSFSMISENLYPLLQSVQYNETVIYHQMCPMAFNDNETAFWLSDNREVVNPYLGKKHPKYASGMLHCGEVKDSLAYAK
ncbi:MAG TPA: DUF3347 domain-containing protein [Chitinophagaceae bacterium]|nr:DUF3347 domain-containing protein [Chitinophagaceae bacterium]